MTYGPPSEPNAYPGPAQSPRYPQPDPNHPQQPGLNHPQQPAPDYPRHLWPGYLQPPGPPAAGSAKGGGLAVAAFLLGLAGCVAPLLPMGMDGFRQYVAFPFALPGIGLAIAGLIGRRRAKPLAVIAAMLCALAIAVGSYMVVAITFNL